MWRCMQGYSCSIRHLFTQRSLQVVPPPQSPSGENHSATCCLQLWTYTLTWTAKAWRTRIREDVFHSHYLSEEDEINVPKGHYLRTKSYFISTTRYPTLIQKMESCIRAEYFASYSSSSRGVAILFNNNFEFAMKKVYKDTAGNYIFASVEIMDKEFWIVSLYGRNR